MSFLQFLINHIVKSVQLSFFTCLMIMILSVFAWYPTYSGAYAQQESAVKKWQSLKKEWAAMLLQGQRIERGDISGLSWGSLNVYERRQDLPSVLLLEGLATLADWQTWLEQIQESVALEVESVDWRKGSNGEWFGRLFLNVIMSQSNREYQDWLPTNLHVKEVSSKDWQFISVMRIDDSSSALLAYKNKWHWVTSGSWLPVAGVTVVDVSFDGVTVQAKDGSKQKIRSKGKEAKND